jgi:hypothetical protein
MLHDGVSAVRLLHFIMNLYSYNSVYNKVATTGLMKQSIQIY